MTPQQPVLITDKNKKLVGKQKATHPIGWVVYIILIGAVYVKQIIKVVAIAFVLRMDRIPDLSKKRI